MMNRTLMLLAMSAAHAEDPRLAAIPYDCLAGVCLNSTGAPPDVLVTVSEVAMHRKVDVCSGHVVTISVSACWISTDWSKSADMLSGAQHENHSEGWTAEKHNDQIRSEMSVLGWRLYAPCVNDAPCSPNLYVHSDRKGDRWTDWQLTASSMGSSGKWCEILMTTHPDKDALCAPKRQQGL